MLYHLLYLVAVILITPQDSLSYTLSSWSYQIVGTNQTKPTKVPTTLTRNLIQQNIIQKPYYRDNFLSFYKYETKDVIYHTKIPNDIIPMCKSKKVQRIVFQGLDTHCDIFVNDDKLLSTHNMYRKYQININNLQDINNQITVRCNSSANFDIQQQKIFKQQFGFDLPQNFSFTRKPAYQYGWDWGPRILTVGIWKQVKLQCFDEVKIERLSLEYSPITYQKGIVEGIQVISDLSHLTPKKNYNIEIQIIKQGQTLYQKSQKFQAKSSSLRFKSQKFSFDQSISSKLIWWTWDIGTPNLFNLTITILDQKYTIQTGFRTVRVNQNTQIGKGQSFTINLNGYDIFIRGGNYIPPEMEMSNRQALKKKYQQVRSQAQFARFNMIRVWGGGHYEHDQFYEQMDKAGILIWHDLMYACALYPIFGEFSTIENIEEQMKDNIGRLGYHPSIGLWNGNNQVWIGWQQWGWKTGLNQTQKQQVQRMYKQIFSQSIPKVISDLTPNIFYWETSPSSSSNSPQTLASGDIHFWRVWGAGTPIQQYETYLGRFNSQYGMQSMPQYPSILEYTAESDRQINSLILRLHQRHPKGDQYLPMYTDSVCGKANNLKQFSYYSQIMQSYSLEIAIRSLRGCKPICMGSLYWQLNDVWPVSSWATVDYYGNYKASHYKIRESYSLLYTNVYHETSTQNYIAYIVNQNLDKKNFLCNIRFIDIDGTILKNLTYEKSVEKLGQTIIAKFQKSALQKEFKLNKIFINIQIRTADRQTIRNNFFFGRPVDRFILFPDLSHSFTANSIRISTKYVANYVYIRSKTNKHLHLNQNYFDMIPGQIKQVELPSQIDHSDIQVTCYQNQQIYGKQNNIKIDVQ